MGPYEILGFGTQLRAEGWTHLMFSLLLLEFIWVPFTEKEGGGFSYNHLHFLPLLGPMTEYFRNQWII